MQALSEKGTALLAKFKKFQKLSLVLYALAAMAFVFAGNILLAIIIVALDIFLEISCIDALIAARGWTVAAE